MLSYIWWFLCFLFVGCVYFSYGGTVRCAKICFFFWSVTLSLQQRRRRQCEMMTHHCRVLRMCHTHRHTRVQHFLTQPVFRSSVVGRRSYIHSISLSVFLCFRKYKYARCIVLHHHAIVAWSHRLCAHDVQMNMILLTIEFLHKNAVNVLCALHAKQNNYIQNRRWQKRLCLCSLFFYYYFVPKDSKRNKRNCNTGERCIKQ